MQRVPMTPRVRRDSRCFSGVRIEVTRSPFATGDAFDFDRFARALYKAEIRNECVPIGLCSVFSIRLPSACAASKKPTSFRVVSACSGVFVRVRRIVQDSRLVASKLTIAGYGADRRTNV